MTVIMKGLVWDAKQNIVIPQLPKDLGPWSPPGPHKEIESFDFTHDAIVRYVVYNRDPSETKADLLRRWHYTETKRMLKRTVGVLIRERVVFLKHARVYAVELVYAVPDHSSPEFQLHMERRRYDGLTFEEYQKAMRQYRIQEDVRDMRRRGMSLEKAQKRAEGAELVREHVLRGWRNRRSA